MVYDSILLTLCTKISVMSISRFRMGINTIVRVAAVAVLCCISLTAAEAKTEAKTETNVVAATVAKAKVTEAEVTEANVTEAKVAKAKVAKAVVAKAEVAKAVVAEANTKTSTEAKTEVRLPAVISDGMLIQRDEPFTVWGWAEAGESFGVCWQDVCYPVQAGCDGRWQLELPQAPAGGPYTLKIADKEIKDILVGDLFLCSGQSNMELPVRRVTDMFAREIASYTNNQIRYFHVPNSPSFDGHKEDVQGSWKAVTQADVMEMSALSYFFAKELNARTGIPVGIVNASVGGTPVEAWISEEALADYPKYISEKKIYESEAYRNHIKALEGENFYRWNTSMDSADPGLNGSVKWYSQEYDDTAWRTVNVFKKGWGHDGLNPVGGSHWLRQDIDLPAYWAGKKATIRLGCIVDADSVYVNGHFVGNTTYQYPPRIYRIPEGVLKPGRNTVTVRVISNGGQPSFVDEKPYKIICGNEEIKLSDIWKYHLGTPMPKAPSMMFFYYVPTTLYSGMIAPLVNLNFKGVVWYQGESNVERRNEYAGLLTTMIKDWRTAFDDEDLPFYIVELADFLHKSDKQGRKAWQEMRDIQAQAAEMNQPAVLIKNKDLGEWNDIHPLDKKTLGKRVADAVMEK